VFPLKDNIPTERLPLVTVVLIAANVLVYVVLQRGGWEITSLTAGDWSFAQKAAYPCDLANRCGPGELPPDHLGAPLSVLSSMFMHGGLLHLGGNMLFLWIFGNNVEDSMGRLTFLAFYLVGGVAAMAAQTLVDPSAAVPTVGASGAVSAVLGAYLLLYPRARVITLVILVIFITLIELPAVLVLALWFGQQLLFSALDYGAAGTDGGVAYMAHIGGFVYGLLVIRLLAKPKPQSLRPAPYRV
jgi:membrane associated rhomboid family serine protease